MQRRSQQRTKDRTKINDAISGSEIRLIGPDGEQLGIVTAEEALKLATEKELDLVEIAPQAKPPVCKIMDYGKFKYEKQQKEKLLRKRQQTISVKEVRFRPTTDKHDFDFKLRHARQFLIDGNRVKATVFFRGRQMAHQELGFELLTRFKEQLEDIAIIERSPNMEGRLMIAMFVPDKAKIKALQKKVPNES